MFNNNDVLREENTHVVVNQFVFLVVTLTFKLGLESSSEEESSQPDVTTRL